MPWVDKAPHVKIRRRYHCDVCDLTFEMRHDSSDDPMPDCPACVAAGRALEQVAYQAPRPAINTSKSKAIDLAQKIAEEDYGLTDFNDNQRPGDIAFKPPAPMGTAEVEKTLREMIEFEAQTGPAAQLPAGPLAPDGTRNVLADPAMQAQNFWQGNQGGSAQGTVGDASAAKAASDQARADGIDPVGILEQGRRSGNMPFRITPVAGVDASELPQALQEAQARRGAVV